MTNYNSNDNRFNGRCFLEDVEIKLQKRLEEIGQSLSDGQKEIDNMQEYYWENYTEMDEYGYEDYDNQQALLHQVNANNEKLQLKHRFEKMLDAPFFGRVDFMYDGDDEPEPFYIGIGNFAEEAGHTPLIYDWRAPVSGLFYDYDKGPASYQAPLGTICGEIASKWQYKIRNGRMIYQFESDVKIDDEILMAELGSGGSTALKNIVRTIQKEQNAIIRNTRDKIMVIQGAAGSGKTSIALHRIAYLLYHDLKNLKSSCISVKFSQISALIGFIGFVAFCIYAALFKYFDLAVFLTIAAGTACAQGYALSRKPLTEYLNLLSVGCYAYALGLFFLNSYNVWADWYGGFTMYGSRGGIGPVIAIMVILLAGCITGTVSCFTVRRDKQ